MASHSFISHKQISSHKFYRSWLVLGKARQMRRIDQLLYFAHVKAWCG